MESNAKNKVILMKIKMLIIAILCVFTFYVFGKKNLIVGVCAVMTAANMFGEDYTPNIATTTILLVIIEILIGVSAYMASLNTFSGLIFTFFISFFNYYLFSYDAKPSKTVGFIMTYLLLLYSPVSLSYMPKRLAALTFAGILIMLLYCILSKYTFNKSVNKEILTVIDLIKEMLDLNLSDETINKNKYVNIKLKSIELKISERLGNSKTDLESVYVIHIIIILLNQINTSLPLIKRDKSSIVILEITKKILENIRLYILNENTLDNLKYNLKQHYHELKTDNLSNDINKYNYYTLKASIEESFKYLENTEDITSFYVNEKIKLLKLSKKDFYGLKNNFKMTSLRFNLAIKSSILISLSVFAVNYFNIYEGQWAIYTIALLLLPYAEQSNKKAKDRVIGTIIGAILFNIINLLINNNIILMIIFLFISAYCTISIKSYNIKCIFITFNSLLSIKIMHPNSRIFILTEYRVLFILIGAIATAIIMNVFFPYRLKNDTKNTIIKYLDLNKKILNELETDNIDKAKLDTMLIINNYLWKRINYNNKELKCDNIEDLLSEQNKFITDINFLFKISNYIDNNAVFIKSIANKFKSNIHAKDFDEKTKQLFNSLNSDIEKLILISIYKIYSDIKNITLSGEKAILNIT
ncbi:FUSC family protein [Clostridium sporogenes]|uniref:FUSC family protein n=1 Tax=Clostridium sporogenes TaxID=1509 RepID=A0ABD6RWK6_CLOSG|nr:FUSC family protein [Clostridium sporogenes]OSB18342.1 FUSC family protein [Clostridium sporogenes]